jgi:hypothetical protein
MNAAGDTLRLIRGFAVGIGVPDKPGGFKMKPWWRNLTTFHPATPLCPLRPIAGT